MSTPGLRASNRVSTPVPTAILASVAGFCIPPLASLCLVPFRSGFNSTDDALVLVIVVVGIATTGHRVAGVISALAASTWFDFFFTKPYEHLAINKSSDVETTLLLLVVGVVATELAVQGRRQRRIALEGSNYLALIHDFSEMVATGEPAEFVIIRAAAEISDLLSLRDCRFETELSDKPYPRLGSGGEVVVAGKRWLADDIGLPSPEVELLIESQGRYLGRFLMVPSVGTPVALEHRVVAVAIAGQVGAALANEKRNN